MTFPHYFYLFNRPFHPHPVMELIAYTGGFQVYLHLRRRAAKSNDNTLLPFEQNMWVLVGAVFGALIGSKLLAWAESPHDYFGHLADPHAWLGGKTIVGGLLGGWIGVELAKRILHLRQSTGDLTVLPLIFGMAVGRIGCFLTGLDDHTCGSLADLPWAVNFGDGPRHPTQLYDILFLTLLAVPITLLMRRSSRRVAVGGSPGSSPPGMLFRIFLASYLFYRFLIEFFKPRYHPYLGLSAIQLACLLGLLACLHGIRKIRKMENAAGLLPQEPAFPS